MMLPLFTRCGLIAAAICATLATEARAQDFRMDFQNGVSGWQVVLDGVMGGRSSGRVSLAEPDTLRFEGSLSLANNGGFSQARTSIPEGTFAQAEGIELRVRGDGRTYNFDIRCSNVRLMAGAFQQSFETEADTWTTIRLPFGDFRLYSFGRQVTNAPGLEPARIESVGVTLSDKNEGPFRIEIGSIASYGGQTDDIGKENDLAAVGSSAGLNTLLALIEAADLELPQRQRVTIFAPSDEAFAALPQSTVDALLQPAGRDQLRSILLYHIATGSVSSADLLGRRSVDTLNGQRVEIDTSEVITIGGSRLLTADVKFDGGIVHVIDKVLLPASRSIEAIAIDTPRLSTLAAAIESVGLSEQLADENGPWTVFAPVDSAFANLPKGTVEGLLLEENRAALIELLGGHVVPGRIYSRDLLARGATQTFFGQPISFGLRDGRLTAGNAAILATDIDAANGVIHLIDTVLVPSEGETAESSPEIVEASIRILDLAVVRGVPLFNAGQPAACAAVYEIAIEAIVSLGRDRLQTDVVRCVELALAEAEHEAPAERAWIYRRAIDEARVLLGGAPGAVSAKD